MSTPIDEPPQSRHAHHTHLEDLTDGELLQSFRDGNNDAYAALFTRHQKAALYTARKHTKDHHMAADAVHETFASILASIKAGSGPTNTFTGYLHTSITREIHRQITRAVKETPVSEHTDHPVIGKDLTDELPGTLITDPTLLQALQSLPHRWQLVIWHLDIQDTPPREAAPIFGTKPNAVVALHRRALKGLKQALAQRQHRGTSEASC